MENHLNAKSYKSRGATPSHSNDSEFAFLSILVEIIYYETNHAHPTHTLQCWSKYLCYKVMSLGT